MTGDIANLAGPYDFQLTWLNRILTGVLALEAIISERVRLPIGLWAMALAEKY